ncbi:MacB family efflux pump subunit [Roseibium litorale]|uniref:Pyoverdine export ATP-binding/permease protein PvdT n=1 Tax=Roseibium litorale TaxID=2803841 RepID=A0ABR9CLF4_9HYPH|nr:MacB family efflux pump subunit [Roseibium litorale]MBD8891146.1 MacB family efflux pump subunit [Roseibium litorale]
MLKLRGVGRAYPSGEGTVQVLKGIDLDIGRGEFVAIVGQSGSGKSTLMNILGCLDRPSSGSYEVNGIEISMLEPDDLSRLRREHFGFIFQRYHLLPELNAIGNVEIPAIYAGVDARHRRERAISLLERLGLGDRTTHRPGQLSGGQQQRVSIARALMNGADVILADEPTGALDSQSGADVLAELKALHAVGKTIILVTHDADIASRAERIIEIRDGMIISDSPNPEPSAGQPRSAEMAGAEGSPEKASNQMNWFRARIDRAGEALRMAVRSMLARKVRALLTMLGIVIGIASVVCVVALGTGSQQKVLENISSLGTNTLEIFPGKDFGDMRSGKITTLVVADADQLARQPYVAAVTPTVSTSATLRRGNVEATGQISGVGAGYFLAKGLTLEEGRFFDVSSVSGRQPDGVIDENTRKSLFADHAGSVIGQVILADNVPVRVVGVVAKQQGFGDSQNLSVYLPYTAVQTRLLGSTSLRSITVRVSDEVDMSVAEQAVTEFLTRRHGTKDFFILNTDDIRKTITSTTQTLALLISAIAVIALIVGGIGVMNIMLVTVSERISEIGVRMAVGARQGDILQQFLIEAVLVCLIGGVLGISLALAFGYGFSLLSTNFQLIYSAQSMVAAFAVSSLIGVVFGYLPARNAARLDPVAALSGTR